MLCMSHMLGHANIAPSPLVMVDGRRKVSFRHSLYPAGIIGAGLLSASSHNGLKQRVNRARRSVTSLIIRFIWFLIVRRFKKKRFAFFLHKLTLAWSMHSSNTFSFCWRCSKIDNTNNQKMNFLSSGWQLSSMFLVIWLFVQITISALLHKSVVI